MRKINKHSITGTALDSLLNTHKSDLLSLPTPRICSRGNDVYKKVNKYKSGDLNKELKKELSQDAKSQYNDKILCCYCEADISSDNWHIEHIKDKNTYPDNSFDRDNLLAACEKCNSNYKGTNEIPVSCIPSKITYNFYNKFEFHSPLEYRGLDPDANDTIEILHFNDNNSKGYIKRNELYRHLIEKIELYKFEGLNINTIKKIIKSDVRIYGLDTYGDRLLENPNSPLQPFLS